MVAPTTTRTYDRERVERLRQYHTVTDNGVTYDERLAGSSGMHFTLIREQKHTDDDMEAAEDYLRRNRDVVDVDIALLVDHVEYDENGVIGVGMFLPVKFIDEVKPGDKIICMRHVKSDTMRPRLFVVDQVRNPHYKITGYGDIYFNLCQRMLHPE